MTEPATSTTLWKLADSWPCDYAAVTAPREDKKADFTVQVHLDSCRKCALQKALIKADEQLRNITDRDYKDFCRVVPDGDQLTEEEFAAIQDHALAVREQVVGAPHA